MRLCANPAMAAKDMDVKTHWEKVYEAKAADAVSWYRPHLETSIALIKRAGTDLASSISVRRGGHVIISTFGPQGPLKCSGLDVVRYDAESLHNEFGKSFHLVESCQELHQTPFGTTQQFLYCYCQVG